MTPISEIMYAQVANRKITCESKKTRVDYFNFVSR